MLRSVIRAWRYFVGREGREEVDPAHIRKAVDPKQAVVWVDATSPEDEEALHALKAKLELGATVVDAIPNPASAPSSCATATTSTSRCTTAPACATPSTVARSTS
jgi:hypothetical protein